MDEGRRMILLFPSLIHLRTDEDRAFFKPRSVRLTLNLRGGKCTALLPVKDSWKAMIDIGTRG